MIVIYFHCSKELYKNGTILKPRIPTNRMNCEDTHIKRVCTCQSIDGCLVAIGGFEIGDVVHVYTCGFEGNTYKPTCYEVPDVPFTGEEWIVNDTLIRKLWQIRIIDIHERKHNNMSIDTYSYEFC